MSLQQTLKKEFNDVSLNCLFSNKIIVTLTDTHVSVECEDINRRELVCFSLRSATKKIRKSLFGVKVETVVQSQTAWTRLCCGCI